MLKKKNSSLIAATLLLAGSMALTGCASKSNCKAGGGCNNKSDIKTSRANDPIEPLNRGVYGFNKVTDNLIIKPAAIVYSTILPPPFRQGVSNVFRNMGEIPTFANDLLQGKPREASKCATRFIINSSLGIAGIFDVATEFGIPYHKEDLGQTLTTWGYKDSSYLVLPIIGPSTVRDTIGIVGDYYISPPKYFKPKVRNAYYGTMLLQTRSELLGPDKLITSAGVDEYALVREAYFQHHDFKSDGANSGNNANDPETNEFLGEPPE